MGVEEEEGWGRIDVHCALRALWSRVIEARCTALFLYKLE